MASPEAAMLMASNNKSRGRGRPKVPDPLKSIVSLKASDDLEKWLDELTEVSESGTRSQTLRRALRAFADEQGFKRPMPKR